jgi:3-methylcrotonyl-CoA carboxylase beta subunit
MCGKAYDPRLIFAWPTAQMAVMSGATAANTLLQIEKAKLQSKGQIITEEAEQEIMTEITNRYNEELSPYYAAARLWVDGIINPVETRNIISVGIQAANQSPIEKRFNVGIIQV